MQTRQRELERQIFPTEDIPQEFLASPVLHAYRPQLEVFNASRRKGHGFSSYQFSPNNEKFYRLYLYQGLSIPDRLVIHTEALEIKMKVYPAFAMTAATAFVTYSTMRVMRHSRERLGLRLAVSATAAYFTWSFIRRFYREKFEQAVEPFYEKYGIK